MRSTAQYITSLLLFGTATCVSAQQASDPSATGGDRLQIEIQSPSADFVASAGETTVQVDGIASAIGGVRYLDMIFVLDTSGSLKKTDPDGFRSAGAIGLVSNLSPKSDIKIGVVSFDSKGRVAQPLTSDRDLAAEAIESLPRSGSTNLAGGIRAALEEFEKRGRDGSSRVIMLFTDGMSNEQNAYDAAVEAHAQGVTIQTLLLGTSKKGSSILDTLAWATRGSFVQVSDPTLLPQAFLDLRTTGVDSVTLSVSGSEPVAAKLAGGTFSGEVPLEIGENRIVATATSLDGQTRVSEVTVTVRDASCAELVLTATKQGRPVMSLDDRAVEVVVDASRSMWGRMDGEPKMVVAKDILEEVSYWFPEDLDLALRAYGSLSSSEENNCSDSALLVPFAAENRDPIRRAIAGLRPSGQTPIAYALREAARDFDAVQGDRAVVLVTDGIESCGGDPVRAARDLGAMGIKVHLIGFGLGNAADEDTAGLQAVANASGGRYVTAGSADELKRALTQTVATSFSVRKDSMEVASGSLGANDSVYLPGGDYTVEIHSSPPREVPISLHPRQRLTLALEKRGDALTHGERRSQLPYTSCEDVGASDRRLTNNF